MVGTALGSLVNVAPYAGVVAVIVFAILLAGGILAASHFIGPRRHHGKVKDESYESGVPLVTDARRRFHVRFYVVAVLFLLFDVEVLLLWPWAPVFTGVCKSEEAMQLANGAPAGAGYLLGAIAIFVILLLVGLIYEWKRGVFEWD
jgi:NADH-quinone oxidoreductase subunit A